MSFLNQLKSQASALRSAQTAEQGRLEASTRLTEAAAKTAWLYLQDLAKQLNVLAPSGPAMSLGKKDPWPAMKLIDFQVDARKKMLRDQEVFDYIAMTWCIVPRAGAPVAASISANFPPDLERIESRLARGAIPHDRVEVRNPERNSLQAIRFDYQTEARGGITITLDHDGAKLAFRLANLQGFEVLTTGYAASQIQIALLDELAKLTVGQASSFVSV